MLWPMWVVLIAGSTDSALRAVRTPNVHIRRVPGDLVYAARATVPCSARPWPSRPKPYARSYWQARRRQPSSVTNVTGRFRIYTKLTDKEGGGRFLHTHTTGRLRSCRTSLDRSKSSRFQIGANGVSGHMPSVTAIHARRMQKDQLRAGHTIPPSHSGRQASSRRPCCHKESAVASRLPNLAGRESTGRHRRQLCVSETSLSAPSIEAQLNQPACRRSCDRACGACVSVRVNPRRHRSRTGLGLVGNDEAFPLRDLLGVQQLGRANRFGFSFPAVSPSAFLGACSLRNLRQIAIEVL